MSSVSTEGSLQGLPVDGNNHLFPPPVVAQAHDYWNKAPRNVSSFTNPSFFQQPSISESMSTSPFDASINTVNSHTDQGARQASTSLLPRAPFDSYVEPLHPPIHQHLRQFPASLLPNPPTCQQPSQFLQLHGYQGSVTDPSNPFLSGLPIASSTTLNKT